MIAIDGSVPICWAASSMIGPCTANWPPPDGTKKFTSPAERNASMPNVVGLAIDTNALENTSMRPVTVMIPRIPAYSGSLDVLGGGVVGIRAHIGRKLDDRGVLLRGDEEEHD